MDERAMEMRLRELEHLYVQLGARLAALEAHTLVRRRVDPPEGSGATRPTIPFGSGRAAVLADEMDGRGHG
jgi:hypothetical protein